MRVVMAPDKFAGTLSAPQAAAAMADGWRRRRPRDEVLTVPLADGGPGFVDALHAALGGKVHGTTVTGPLGADVPATVLLVPGDVPTAYLESAQACGIDLLPRAVSGGQPEAGIAEATTSFGVGQLVRVAIDAGAGRVVVGLGGSGTNDAGAGLLAALGATADPDGALRHGARGLEGVHSVDLGAARAAVAGVVLVGASDVTNPLLGLRGATNVFGPQKGIEPERLIPVDGYLTHFAHGLDAPTAARPGAGAAGGLGYGLLLLGGSLEPGIDLVMRAAGLPEALVGASLVITGEGRVDPASFDGKVLTGVAGRAGAAGVPCVVVAGDVQVGARELRAAGVDAGYGLRQLLGAEAARQRPHEALADVVERVCRTWAPR